MGCVVKLLFFFTVIHGIASVTQAFVNLQCKTENWGHYGQHSLLSCVIKTAQEAKNAKIRIVTWKKDMRTLLFFNEGETTEETGYSFAESPLNNTNMNVSLLITNTAVQHAGVYDVMVMTNSGFSRETISLKVTAKYNTPTITSKPETLTLDTDGELLCISKGGYPLGEIRWFDKDDGDWTKSAKMKVKETEGGLFELSSTLSLLRGSILSKYTCRVFNASGGMEKEATIDIPDKPYGQKSGEMDPATKVVAPIVVIGSLVAGLLLALLIYRRRSRRHHREVYADELPYEGEGADMKL